MVNKNRYIIEHNHKVKKEHRNQRNKHRSLVLWFTGLSGSGKSTLASIIEEKLFNLGCNTYILDGDNIRSGLNKDLGFSDQDRRENLRRVSEVAKLFLDAGFIVLAAFISPKHSERELVKKTIGDKDFVEIFVNCPIEICEKRDVKGIYKKARNGEIENFIGVDINFEIPNNPDVEVKTDKLSIDESTKKILDYVLPKIKV